MGSKRRAASHFFELEADVDSDEEGDEEESEAEDDFIEDAGVDSDFVLRRRQVIHPQIGEEEEEEDIDEFERRIEERYGRKSRYEEEEEDETEVFQQALLPTATDSKLWMVKCANYIYIEADKESQVREACKGMRHSFLKNKIAMVPNKEMSAVLSVKNRETEFSKDSWVRLKTGNYRGDLAQIVNVDDIRQRVTVKLIPRIDFQALINKFEGNKPLTVSNKFCPPPRFWSATKAKALGIQ
ncbi:Transcription elongation factor SPT5 [Datura stramonium]|uniref:Transcription elongation factor SPT5 n=1 Tax=Datura stramonium TaxID=4076 RepID=A0ABS8VGZ8_DATST|nr:Transcription elongation factor SPT5 [Datura stramonium]